MEKDYIEKLRQGGYRRTCQRDVIFNALIENPGNHYTPEEIYYLIREKNPELGTATVYRTLQLFESLDIVRKTDLVDGKTRYEVIIDTENHHHHHMICIKCGNVEEMMGDLLGSLETLIEEKYDFKILDHQLRFTGICSNCRKNG